MKTKEKIIKQIKSLTDEDKMAVHNSYQTQLKGTEFTKLKKQ